MSFRPLSVFSGSAVQALGCFELGMPAFLGSRAGGLKPRVWDPGICHRVNACTLAMELHPEASTLNLTFLCMTAVGDITAPPLMLR